jgi:hypothetical protein
MLINIACPGMEKMSIYLFSHQALFFTIGIKYKKWHKNILLITKFTLLLMLTFFELFEIRSVLLASLEGRGEE